MPYKVCPECGAISYSACTAGEWKCPECNADLSGVEEKLITPNSN